MRGSTPWRSLGIAALGIGMWVFQCAGAHAEERQIRLYAGADDTILESWTKPMRFTIQPYFLEYSRFVKGRHVYQEWHMGVRMRHTPWLSTQTEYSPRDRMYPGSPRTRKDVAGFAVLFHPRLGKVRVLNREAGEWHVTDHFYRYRNLTQVVFPTPVKWLSPYVFNEFRVDSDQKRLNVNGTGAGIQIDPAPLATFRIFFNREGNRRNLPDWKYIRYLGFSCALHL